MRELAPTTPRPARKLGVVDGSPGARRERAGPGRVLFEHRIGLVVEWRRVSARYIMCIVNFTQLIVRGDEKEYVGSVEAMTALMVSGY